MGKKLVAIMLGILVAGLLASTAFAGDHGFIDLNTIQTMSRTR